MSAALKVLTQSKDQTTRTLYADDCALLAHTEADLQYLSDNFDKAWEKTGIINHRPCPTQWSPAST
jgi:hypothetical protein